MKDESITISNRFVIWLELLPAFPLACCLLLISWGIFNEGKDVQDRWLTAALFATGGVVLFLILISIGRGFASASVRDGVLTVRSGRRRWEIPVEQVRDVVTYPSLSHIYPKTIRLVFDERSPIRDAVLAVNWLEEPVDSIEELIEQAKRNAERYAPYRPA